MQRVLVILLSALDALVAAAIGVAVALAPLTVLWFVAFGAPDLGLIWQSSAVIWQLGHVVPVAVTLPEAYLAQTGIDASVASFSLSLAPLALAAFTFLFAARSGARAGRAGAGLTGALSGSLVFAALAALVALTGAAPAASVELWQAILFPVAFYAAGSVAGVVRVGWNAGDGGSIDALRGVLDRRPGAWPEVPELLARGGAIALTGLIGAGALALAVALVIRGPQIVALSQAANLDALGAVVVAFGQALYLPTLVIWAIAFLAGPGIGLGGGSLVAPVGTQLGIVPGIPVLGVLPETSSSWLLALALVPIAAGAFAGWAVRSRLEPRGSAADAETPGILWTLTGGIALIAALGTALLCTLASGSMGPGRLAEVGPDAAIVGVTVGIEVGLGAAILLLSPRRRSAARVGSSGSDHLRSRDEDDRSARGLPGAESPLSGRSSSSGWGGSALGWGGSTGTAREGDDADPDEAGPRR
ncbi:DUF6350 family protein [Microbacterium sp. NPDC089189]|uniref:cell division protein PerM n=1 Tax=Microbacterium sp. NPDC089189 TaxID=3154972 RepID=UPI00343D246D